MEQDPLMSWQLIGGRWRWIPVALRIKALEFPSAISCIAGASCELVGRYSFGGPGGGGFIERFNGSAWRPDETQAPSRGGFGNVSCIQTGLCVATEDRPGVGEPDGGLSGIVTQAREDGRWITLGRGLPGGDQLVVAEGGAHCFPSGWCVVVGGSNTGMFVAPVVHRHLAPLAVVRGVHLNGAYPYLDALACASPTFCVETSQNQGSPYVLTGSVASLTP
jgi:hypothetical protein